MFKLKKVISTNALIQTLSKLYPAFKLNDVITLKNKEYIYMGDIPSGIMYREMSNDNIKLLKWQKIPLQTIWQINSNKVINLYIEHTNTIKICKRKIYKLNKKMNTNINLLKNLIDGIKSDAFAYRNRVGTLEQIADEYFIEKFNICSLASICADYKNNELAGDAKYAGKKWVIQGQITEIAKVGQGASVTIKGGFLKSLMCFFDKKHKAKLITLNTGQEVYIEGICKGLSFSIITFENCRIIE